MIIMWRVVSTGFYAGQFDAGLRSGYGVKIENPTEKHKRVFDFTALMASAAYQNIILTLSGHH